MAGRIQDAAVHLRESLQLALRTGVTDPVCDNLDCCGHLCAATGRFAEALTVWAAWSRSGGTRRSRTCRWTPAAGTSRCAGSGVRSARPGHVPPRNAARR